MKQIRVRCPACQKLYEVETDSIYSHSPHFDCKACHSIFSFQFPPVDPAQVPTFLVGNLVAEEVEIPAVILQAQPSLVQLWNRIFEDYDDQERHEDFVKRCVELEALPYAQTKYQELKAALGSDELCDKYLAQVEARLTVKADFKVQYQMQNPTIKRQWVNLHQVLAWLKAQSWKKVLYWAPFVSGLLMVILGFSNLGLRNMIGLGFAVTFLGYGLITVVFGRIRVSDFID